MQQNKRIAQNTAVSVFARTLGLVLAFFSLGIVTRYLGPDKAGSYFTVLAYVGIFSVFADLGLYQILLRNISRPDADESGIFSSFFSLRVVSLLAILGIIAPLVVIFLPYEAVVKIGVVLGSFIFICLSLITLFVAVFQKHLRMHIVAAGEFFARIIQFVLVFLLLRAGYGVLAALGAMLAASVVHLVVVAVYARQHIPYRFTFNLASWKGILRVSYPVALSTVFSFIYFKIDTLMISYLKPAYDVGIYGLAYKILEMLVAYPAIYVGLLIPVLTSAALRERKIFFKIMRQAFTVLSFAALPMLVGGWMLAPKIISIFGDGYGDSIGVLMLLLGATFSIFFGTLYSNALIIVNKQMTLAHIYFWGMVFNIGSNIYAIPRWSYTGAAWTTLLTEIGVTLAMVILLRRYGWLRSEVWYVPFRVIAATLLMALVLLLFSSYTVFVLVPLGCLSYFAFLVLFRAISIPEIKKLMPM